MLAHDVLRPGVLGRSAWRHWGSSDRVVVLLPGFTCNAADWPRPLIRRLVTQGWEVAAVDWPDSGHSERIVGGSYGLRDLARQVSDGLAPWSRGKEVHWLGFSMGSLVAQLLPALGVPAASYTHLGTSSGSWGDGLGRWGTLARLLSVRMDSSREEVAYALTALREELAYRPLERDLAELRRRVHASVARAWPYGKGPWRQLAAVTDFFASGGAGALRSQAPTLILHGARDPLLPVAGARALARKTPGSRYLELPDVGHELLLSRLDDVLGPWLEHLEASSRRARPPVTRGG